ncbi:MAG TPA: DUF86 domain-containing protein [Thermoanaerobaculia bacterium]|nr:DUF86 domain-containing protein [Thermoanaerobaculia bacterium]
MILRREIVRDRLHHLRTVSLRLQEIQQTHRQAFLASYQLQWTTERGLQLAAQAILDIGTHILSGRFNVHPADYEDVIRLMGVHGIVSDELQSRLRGLGGFRNILVHGYLEIDIERVYEFLCEESSVFRDFANAIDEWLEQNG